jgi:hypothetical protein
VGTRYFCAPVNAFAAFDLGVGEVASDDHSGSPGLHFDGFGRDRDRLALRLARRPPPAPTWRFLPVHFAGLRKGSMYARLLFAASYWRVDRLGASTHFRGAVAR